MVYFFCLVFFHWFLSLFTSLSSSSFGASCWYISECFMFPSRKSFYTHHTRSFPTGIQSLWWKKTFRSLWEVFWSLSIHISKCLYALLCPLCQLCTLMTDRAYIFIIYLWHGFYSIELAFQHLSYLLMIFRCCLLMMIATWLFITNLYVRYVPMATPPH